ncbi:MAG: DUF3078 domain-containing protein [Cyclobacteriaceae bacterium]|nr:DUF3078 domain-containing protein [Cyclobacteriaceae bacterium]
MKRLILLTWLTSFAFIIANAQTLEELKAQRAAKKDTLARLEGEIGAIQGQIDALPGWKVRAFGTIGVNLSRFNDWFSKGTPNSAGGNIAFAVNGIANLDQEKFFWRNSATVNLAWIRFDDRDDPDDDSDFEEATDVFNINSLYGRKLSDNWAASGLVEYRTTLLSNFNDPGYLDLGVGFTWTPATDLVVVIHPLNYNIVFSDMDAVFDSSLGAKIMADYARQLPGGVTFKTNFSTFQSYKSSDLSNWTWTNSFGYTFWKVVGVGFEFGLRGNKQEALNYEITELGNEDATFDTIDNQLQSYWILGLSYSF